MNIKKKKKLREAMRSQKVTAKESLRLKRESKAAEREALRLQEEARGEAKAIKRKLLAELKDASKERQREIRIELGIASLADLLGDSLPVKVCKHCGTRAMSHSDCLDWKGQVCRDCNRLLAHGKVNIVGPHSLLRDKPKVCKCGADLTYSKHKVCDVCLGKLEVLSGMKVPHSIKGVPVVIDNITYSSVGEASRATGIPYSTVSYRVTRGVYKVDLSVKAPRSHE